MIIAQVLNQFQVYLLYITTVYNQSDWPASRQASLANSKYYTDRSPKKQSLKNEKEINKVTVLEIERNV